MPSDGTEDPVLSPPSFRIRDDRRFGAAMLAHGWRLLLVFVGLLLPLWALGALIESLQERDLFAFDLPLLRAVHGSASAALDRLFLDISALGYAWGVLPAGFALLLWLLVRRHTREALFAFLSIYGSLLLSMAAKRQFARARPHLWPLPSGTETGYSFPSGHAMASMTLAMVVVLLCWNLRTRRGWSWRWPVTVAALAGVLLVGLSRIYLGAHYPSDVLAGWAAAIAWVVSVFALVFSGPLQPFRDDPSAPLPRRQA